MKKALPIVGLLCLFTAQGVNAKDSPVNLCTASLQPNARLVFNAVASKPQPAVLLRTVLEARVRELVFSDRLAIGAARPAAEAASECLRIARNCSGDVC
jgi:hypothetical protein